MVFLSLIFLACSGNSEQNWSSVEDCDVLQRSSQRDECYGYIAPQVFRAGKEEGEALVGKVEDPLTKDYIYLTVTREIDPSSAEYCKKIQMPKLAERCELLVARPHLHRGLKKDEPVAK